MKDIKLLREIAYQGCKGRVLLKQLSWLCYALANFGNIIVIQILYDAITKGERNKTNIIYGIIAFGGMLLFANLFMTITNILNEKLSFLFMENLENQLQHKMQQYSSVSYEENSFLDEIHQAHQGVGNACFLLNLLSMLIWYYIPYLCMVGAYFLWSSPVLILLLLFFVLPIGWGQLVKYKENEKTAETIAKCERKKDEYVSYFSKLNYVKENRIFGSKDFFLGLFRKNMEEKKSVKADKAKQLMHYSFQMDVISTVCYVAGIAGMVILTYEGKMGIPAFGAILTSIASVSAVLKSLLGSHLGRIVSQAGNIKFLLQYLRKGNGGEEREFGDESIQSIELNHVKFAYPNVSKKTDTEYNCRFEKREIVVIVGENGAGKSTFIKLLTGMYPPCEGTVTYNEKNIAEFSRKSILKKCTVLFQEFQKYYLSVKENVALSEGEENKVQGLLQKADVWDKVCVLPEKMNTVLGKEFGGEDLSGGYWQRLAFARCMYKEADIICMDEPTSAIDPLEETKLYKTFYEMSQGKFAFIVSHRLGLCKIADRILVMKNGKIVEDGSHEELMNACGLYKELYEKQANY